ncbi:MAG TPA: GNAT family N-acetyltransferase [Caulobacteraceae bacterium]|jgi:ribosomal protein S18 acetylase RimI-like enzyme
MNYAIRQAGPDDAPLLSKLARETFVETFGHLYPEADLNAFLQASYEVETLRGEIAKPRQQWLIAEDEGGEPVGYAQAGPCALPHADVSDAHGELKRIYIRRSAQGTGLGRDLMDRSLAYIAATFEGPVWIGVWSENHKAQRLYERYGFSKAGSYEFAVGSVRDDEFILMRH